MNNQRFEMIETEEENNFFEDDNPIIEESNELDRAIEDFEKLSYNEKADFSETEDFKTLIGIIGETPPIKLLEDIVTHYKNKKQGLLRQTIPAQLHEMGVNKLVTKTGYEVSLKNNFHATTLDKGALFDFLKERGDEHILKTIIELPYGEYSDEIGKYLKKNKYTFTISNDTHWKKMNSALKLRTLKHEENKTKKEVTEEDIKQGALPAEGVVNISMFEYANIKQKES